MHSHMHSRYADVFPWGSGTIIGTDFLEHLSLGVLMASNLLEVMLEMLFLPQEDLKA